MVILNIIKLASSFLYSLNYFYTELYCAWRTILEKEYGHKDTINNHLG